jgi:2-methylisocitrate lyase-like PEP mutase family enzyme
MAYTNGDDKKQIPAAARLRELLADQSKIITCPGVYDGLTARIALNAGHECLYMTGAGTTMSRLGLPDLGIATLNDMHANAAMIASLDRRVPLIADADTGYGGPIMVGRTVAMYMQAGVAGLHIEDQVQTKRCGHLAGKELVELDVYLSRIKAAAMSRDRELGDIVIIARTDALQSLGYEEAIKRLKMAVKAGADVAFLEGIATVEQAKQACQDLAPTPLLLNMVQGGLTPNLTAQEAQDLGFRIIIFPGLALSQVLVAVTGAMDELKRTGTVKKDSSKLAKSLSPRALFEVCGLNECMAFDKEAGGVAFAHDV